MKAATTRQVSDTCEGIKTPIIDRPYLKGSPATRQAKEKISQSKTIRN